MRNGRDCGWLVCFFFSGETVERDASIGRRATGARRPLVDGAANGAPPPAVAAAAATATDVALRLAEFLALWPRCIRCYLVFTKLLVCGIKFQICRGQLQSSFTEPNQFDVLNMIVWPILMTVVCVVRFDLIAAVFFLNSFHLISQGLATFFHPSFSAFALLRFNSQFAHAQLALTAFFYMMNSAFYDWPRFQPCGTGRVDVSVCLFAFFYRKSSGQ